MAMTIGGSNVETVLMPAIAAAGGGVIEVPAGVSSGFFAMGTSNVWFRGTGPGSIMRYVPSGPSTNLIDGGGAAWYSNVRFSDILFDGNAEASLLAMIRAPGYGTDRWTFERCHFRNFPGSIAFAAAQVTGTKFLDCTFSNPGDMTGVGIQVSESAYDLDIVGCQFNWLGAAMTVEATEVHNRRLRFLRNLVRQDYWGMKAHSAAAAAGSGGTVSYTATALIDTSKDFTTIPLDTLRTIRVMTILRAATTTNVGNTLMVDGAANFVTLAPKYGDIVRTASAWTMVVGTMPGSTTQLAIDGWRDLTTYLPTTAPSIGTAYTLYRITIGETESYTGTTQINTPRWRDLLGNTVSPPAAGTRFEVLGARASGGINWEETVSDSVIAENIFHGGWSDQITVRGDRCVIADNVAVHGQDIGLTCNGTGHVIRGGNYSYNGASGINIPNGTDIVIEGVTCLDNFCENANGNGNNIQLEGDRILVHGCVLRKINAPNCLYGVYVRGGADDCRVLDNLIQGHTFQVAGEASPGYTNLQAAVLIGGKRFVGHYPGGVAITI